MLNSHDRSYAVVRMRAESAISCRGRTRAPQVLLPPLLSGMTANLTDLQTNTLFQLGCFDINTQHILGLTQLQLGNTVLT